MSAARAIKNRIKSAKNISKITKAMEMVSASKMRRAQQQAILSRPYAENLKAILQKISLHTDPELHPLLKQKTTGKTVLVMISTDRGLVGGLNANLFRAVMQWKQNHPNPEIIVIGRKAKSFCRMAGLEMYAEFSDLPDKVTYPDTLPMSKLLLNGFLSDEFQSVHLIHMESITTLSQKPVFTPLLPISPLEIENPSELVEVTSEYVFEPNAKEVLNWLLPYFVENVLYFSMLEGKASEHSARMIAMKNASDNAKEIVNVLNLEFNRSRQAHITQELQEITTATLALG